MEALNALSYTFNSIRHEMVCRPNAISGLTGGWAAPGRRGLWYCAARPFLPTRTSFRGRGKRWETALPGCTPASRR